MTMLKRLPDSFQDFSYVRMLIFVCKIEKRNEEISQIKMFKLNLTCFFTCSGYTFLLERFLHVFWRTPCPLCRWWWVRLGYVRLASRHADRGPGKGKSYLCPR